MDGCVCVYINMANMIHDKISSSKLLFINKKHFKAVMFLSSDTMNTLIRNNAASNFNYKVYLLSA